jgi:AraC family transcriptional regulator
MNSPAKVPAIDYMRAADSAKIFPLPPIVSSQQAGWQNIQLAHYLQPAWEVPEFTGNQIAIVMSNLKCSTEVTLVANGKVNRLVCNEDRSGLIEILPAHISIRSSWTQEVEFTHLYLEPSFISRIAYESVDPDRVELALSLQQPSALVWSMGEALKSILQTAERYSCFYADSMATGLAAHLLTHYATRKHVFREYNGLPKAKLKGAIEYINTHFGEDISLTDIATAVGMSQYYFSRLFKQSIGMTPHTYLVVQRVNHAKELLSTTELTILEIANECGFANPSHFAKCFRQHTGISPKQFRLVE